MEETQREQVYGFIPKRIAEVSLTERKRGKSEAENGRPGEAEVCGAQRGHYEHLPQSFPAPAPGGQVAIT